MDIYKKIKNFLKKNISGSLIDVLKLCRQLVIYPLNYLYDSYRYARYSSTFIGLLNKVKLRSMLNKNFHIIEKGLSLYDTRSGFGQPVIVKTLKLLNRYITNYGADSTVWATINSLSEYQSFNLEHGVRLSFLDEALDDLKKLVPQSLNHEGGTVSITRKEILSECSGSFKQLAKNRHSIRVFSKLPVDESLIREAANIAKKTPSVCNRQTTSIFVYGGEEQKKQILALQNGNRGFGHLASHIVAVTSDLQCFIGTGERNQAYVDGGLMAMSFVYALQSLGIGSCFLNWSVTADLDMEIKKVAGIPASHVIVTLIAIGNIPDELLVAESPRLSLNDILYIQ